MSVWRLEAGLLVAVLAVALAGGFDGSDPGSAAFENPVEAGVIHSAGAPAHPASTTSDAPSAATSEAPSAATSEAPSAVTSDAPSAANSEAPPAAKRRASLLFSGDVLPHGAVQRQADEYGGPGVYDFGPMFAEVAPIVSAADLAICHMETPLSADSTDLSGFPNFNSPGELGTAIADAGYDGCSLASNHAYDRGAAGVRSTVAVMERSGLGFAGMARSQVERDTPRLYDVNGISIAHLSYTFNLNLKVLPDAEPYLANVIDQEAILAEAGRARTAGADFVVLSMHWGNDYQQRPNWQQLELTDVLLPHPDVDLIIGHHAHVAQPWDRRGDEIVVYGLGNSLSNQSASCCDPSTQDGVMARLQIEEQSDGRFLVVDASYVATWVDRSDFTIVPVAEALASGDRADQADTLRTSQARTASAVNALGADAWGVRPADTG